MTMVLCAAAVWVGFGFGFGDSGSGSNDNDERKSEQHLWILHTLTPYLCAWYVRVAAVCSCFLAGIFVMRHGSPPVWSAQWPTLGVFVTEFLDAVFVMGEVCWENARSTYFWQLTWYLGDLALLRVLAAVISAEGVGDGDFAFGMFGVVSAGGHLTSVTSFVAEYLPTAYLALTIGAFHFSLVVLSFVRVVSFHAHLFQHRHVFDFLRQTGWRRTVNFVPL